MTRTAAITTPDKTIILRQDLCLFISCTIYYKKLCKHLLLQIWIKMY